jgi:broad specificity polyphosphatase/5'/3'-nucleotidase SurE
MEFCFTLVLLKLVKNTVTMNPTEFKNKLLELNLNKVEKERVKNIRTKSLKFDLRVNTDFSEITDDNYKQVWFQLNQQYAKDDKFHRIQTHSMRNCRGFEDYSDMAYNNSSDDL